MSQPEAARRADGSCILPLPRRGHAPSTAGIDALHACNAAGFVNFACVPNMAARGVLCEHSDAALPHVAFFATRDIAAGEELTDDYSLHHALPWFEQICKDVGAESCIAVGNSYK